MNSLLTDSFKEFFKVRMRRSWENMPGTKSFPQNISAKRKNLFGHSEVLENIWNKWSKARKCITRVISLNNIQIVVFKCIVVSTQQMLSLKRVYLYFYRNRKFLFCSLLQILHVVILRNKFAKFWCLFYFNVSLF